MTSLEWKELSFMSAKRCYVGSVVLDSRWDSPPSSPLPRLVALGGRDQENWHRSAEIYSPGHTWCRCFLQLNS